jgi:mannose-1-phosphate guanylyltransferase/mannose-6-phosphate isomerase
MSAPKILPVIMCGGAGTRLWPMSRKARPKQFAALTSDRSLFQETALRVAPPEGFLAPLVIAGEEHAALIAEQLREIGVKPAAIVLEPVARNTAAVAAVAAEWARVNAKGSPVLLLPADHHIGDAAGFRRIVVAAAPMAASGRIVTFGVKPTEPHTGFGYLERGAAIGGDVAAVKAFREKPDAETAAKYVRGGDHLWNAGIFLYDPATMLAEFAAHAPEIGKQAAAALAAAKRDGAVVRLDRAAFEKCPANSVDYAVMEKAGKIAVVSLNAGWSDVGSWSALTGEGDHPAIIAIDAEGCVIRTDGPLVGVVGVSDLVIVATKDAVLVAPKDRAQEVKKIVEELAARGRTDLL